MICTPMGAARWLSRKLVVLGKMARVAEGRRGCRARPEGAQVFRYRERLCLFYSATVSTRTTDDGVASWLDSSRGDGDFGQIGMFSRVVLELEIGSLASRRRPAAVG